MEPLTPKKAQQVADILDEALALMNDTGAHWLKGSYMGLNDAGEPAYCSAGAIMHIVHKKALGYSSRCEAINALASAYVQEHDGERTITRWNDRSDTTWDKVVKRFTKAKERVLKQAQQVE